jgi:MFS family permease
MRGFTILWLGQIISLLGSAMTWFAFTIWAWKLTGRVSALSTITFFAFLPTVLLAPVAGAFVDRWNRKLVMLLSDAATAIGTLAALILYSTNQLQLWHIYAIGILAGFFTAFQYPAYSAAVTTMLPKEQFARAGGMLGLATAVSTVFAPPLAAILLNVIDMRGIMVIDLVTFLAAFASLTMIHIPQPIATTIGSESRGNLRREILFGFHYINQRKSLVSLTKLFIAGNFFIAIGATLMAPLILSATHNNASAWATVQSMGAVGGLVGGGLLSLWGGPKIRIQGILLGGIGACLLGILWLGLSQAILFWRIGAFFFSFFEPFVEGGNLAVWQSKVEADAQGRVLSARHLLVQIPYLIGVFISGYLAEFTSITSAFILAGLCGAAVFVIGYASNPIRKVELLLPDAQ